MRSLWHVKRWSFLSQKSLLCRPTPLLFLLWPLSPVPSHAWDRSTIHFELSFPPRPTRGSSDSAETGSKTRRGQPRSLTIYPCFWARGKVGWGGRCLSAWRLLRVPMPPLFWLIPTHPHPAPPPPPYLHPRSYRNLPQIAFHGTSGANYKGIPRKFINQPK